MMKFEKARIIIPVVFLGTILLFSCFQRHEQWDDIKIASKIATNSIYHRLDELPEIYNGLEQLGSSKRTSDVQYYSGDPADFKKDKFSKVNNCRAYFFKSDTLSIIIGISDDYSAEGFTIKCKANKFYIKPYTSTDAIIEGEPKPTYKIVYQKLLLDKSTFSVGDSIHGYVNFKSIETTPEGTMIDHIGKGFFRAIIEKD